MDNVHFLYKSYFLLITERNFPQMAFKCLPFAKIISPSIAALIPRNTKKLVFRIFFLLAFAGLILAGMTLGCSGFDLNPGEA